MKQGAGMVQEPACCQQWGAFCLQELEWSVGVTAVWVGVGNINFSKYIAANIKINFYFFLID